MQKKLPEYDYIILGAGCAGLSLLMRILKEPLLASKKILLIDKAPKDTNDRTWCFWEKQPGFFENIVHKNWAALTFASPPWQCQLDIAPYQYKMIRGLDFYNHCFKTIKQHKNADLLYDEIISFSKDQIILANTTIFCEGAIVFNTTYKQVPQQQHKHYLLQHFKGVVVETGQPFFNEAMATLMDFRVPQTHGTAFVYVMPISPFKALVEYTLFTKELLKPQQYDEALHDYIDRIIKLSQYNIIEEEFGVIPMTNASFKQMQNGVYNLGTASGQTKGSTGYTFQFIQKQTTAVVAMLVQQANPLLKPGLFHKRFSLYDSTLLNVLVNQQMNGADFFTLLYQRNKASLIFKFLDNETSLSEEIKLMNTVPRWMFVKAALQEIFT